MSGHKRKGDIAHERPEKKLKAEKSKAEKSSAEKPKSTKSHTTVLQDDETAFPRGGKTILTPLEKRQIQIRAREDVLFEQSTGKKARNEFDSDDDGDGNDDDDIPEQRDSAAATASASKLKSNKKKDKHKSTAQKEGAESELKVQSLSYKRLVQGSVVLGQITSINKYDITISLPNNLTGYVPLTAVSDRATQVIEALAAQEDSDSDEADDAEQPEEFRLQHYVRLGQYVRAYVSAVGSEEQESGNKGNKKHVTLSLMPEQANSNLSRSDLVTNNVVQASVESVEDHGLVMNIGLEGSSVKAFMGSTELPSDLKIPEVHPGAILLCLITGLSSSGKVVKLSANQQKLGSLKKGGYLADAPSVDAFQPGGAVDVLVSEASERGVVGKVMGLLDATADLFHCMDGNNKAPMQKRFPVGSKARARVICTFAGSEEKKIGISFLPHLLALGQQKSRGSDQIPKEALPVSSIVQEAKVVSVEDGTGVFFDVGVKGVQGFAHISRLSDERINSVSGESGPYKVGTMHKARVISYNPLEGLFMMSLEKSTLEMPFINLEDVQVGAEVKATVERVNTPANGSVSIILRLTKHIDGLVPEMHISDVQLQNPEKKFKEGSKVSARVLSVDLERRRLRLTLKKSLVNSEASVWSTYEGLLPGDQSPGTIVNILSSGAVVQYYGDVRGFLPVSQMSETFIKDPQQHFRVGQVVTTHILNVQPEERKMTVSCRDPSLFGPKQQQAFDELKIGSTVSGVVSEKTNDEIVLEVGDAKIKAMLHIDQLADGSVQKCLHSAKRIRVSQTLQNLLVIQKSDSKKLIHLSDKPSLRTALEAGQFPSTLEELDEGKEVVGYVRNVTATAVYVQFASDLVGILPRSQLPDDVLQKPGFGYRRNATITCRVFDIEAGQNRFSLTQKPLEKAKNEKKGSKETENQADPAGKASGPDSDLQFGTIVDAKINSVKDTQLNVTIREGVQGRIDISQVFDNWDEIKDRKKPLQQFKNNETIKARIIGRHNHRNHKFLPITHSDRAKVFELTARKTDLQSNPLKPLALSDLKQDQECLCFVNNVSSDCLWVNLSPNVRGRIRAIDASDNTSILSNLEDNFPPGSAVRAHVLHADTKSEHLDLSARTGTKEAPQTFADLKEGTVLPAKVTRVSDRQIMVQLSDTLSGPIHLVEMADDFAKANPADFEKNQIIRVHVSGVDVPNKKLTLSTRPSKVLSSSLPVTDKVIKSLKQIKISDVVRGFIKNVADNGIFVALSSDVTAFVRVAELSDSFIKDWKSEYEVDRLVRGKVIAVDASSNHLQLSLKQSVVDNKNYHPPLTYRDLKVGQIVTGKVRKVEDFGVFVAVDNSANVSGLCHRSELADETILNVKSLYDEGDQVKAKVLKVDHEKRRVAFGLKASYFQDDDQMDVDGDEAEDMSDVAGSETIEAAQGVLLDVEDSDASSVDLEERDLDNVKDIDDLAGDDDDGGISLSLLSKPSESQSLLSSLRNGGGLNVGSLDWEGNGLDDVSSSDDSDSDQEAPRPKKKRRPQIQIDRTAELDVNGPQSVADFERLLLTELNSSYLWLSYMAYYLQLNEIGKAREIAERAIKTVNHQSRETEEEALNVWVGYLNLENTYGNEDTLTEIFSRAKQYNDAEDIHSRLASIYIQSEKIEQADSLFQSMVKKFSQDPRVWLNYAAFLFNTVGEPVRGRDLLPRALQALPKHQHLDLTTKFAQLEFKSPKGDSERGRTMFEGLITTYPNKPNLYKILLDLEEKTGDKDRVRRLFQRMTAGKLKPEQAKKAFKRWIQYEEKEGDAKSVRKVKARAEEYERKRKDNE